MYESPDLTSITKMKKKKLFYEFTLIMFYIYQQWVNFLKGNTWPRLHPWNMWSMQEDMTPD